MKVGIEVLGARRSSTRLAQIPAAMHDGLLQALRRGLLRVHHAVVAEELRGGTLNTRTGTLGRAIFWRIEADQALQQIVGRVGVDLAKALYGRVQALGGVITPKRAKHLTIPVGEALTGNGVARFTARELMANPKAFGYRTAFVNPRQTAILGVRPDRSLEPLFALKTQVTIPPRNYLAAGLQRVRSAITADFRRAVANALKSQG